MVLSLTIKPTTVNTYYECVSDITQPEITRAIKTQETTVSNYFRKVFDRKALNMKRKHQSFSSAKRTIVF